MTNPTPRPALRKAEDATVHPAAPRPARTSRSATKAAPAPAVEPVVETAAAPVAVVPEAAAPPAKGGKKKRKFGGATSDHLRPDAPAEAPTSHGKGSTAPHKSKSDKGSAVSEPVAPIAPVEPKAAPKKSKGGDDLMTGKQVDLDVKIPKALRKAAAARAKSEGLDLQTVVIDALHAYTTAPPR